MGAEFFRFLGAIYIYIYRDMHNSHIHKCICTHLSASLSLSRAPRPVRRVLTKAPRRAIVAAAYGGVISLQITSTCEP